LKLNEDGELSLIQFVGDEIPEYAILSHTWGADGEEVTFEDLLNGTGKDKTGYEKIRHCAKQADLDGLKYSWVDTCCIQKSSSSELSEAINSMFQWYNEAKICYAYLSDVVLATGDSPEELLATGMDDFLKNSRWFTRGWTLQELLAPKLVIFFDSNWRKIGDKTIWCDVISSITGIEKAILLDSSNIDDELYSKRIHWAAKRKTSRPEDIIYCLMGLFRVHLPLIYGEGAGSAFTRLQHELFKLAPATSLLTWGKLSEHPIDPEGSWSNIFPYPLAPQPMFAQSPQLFTEYPVWHRLHTSNDTKPCVITNRGIETQVEVITHNTWLCKLGLDSRGVVKTYDLAIAILPFRTSEKEYIYLGILLSGNSLDGTYHRVSSYEGCMTVKVPARLALLAKPKRICLSDEPVYRELRYFNPAKYVVIIECKGFCLHHVLGDGCEWNTSQQCLTLQAPQSVLLRFVDEKHRESDFHLLISPIPPTSNFVKGEKDEGEEEGDDDERDYRRFGITIVKNDHAEKLFNNALELSILVPMASERKVTVNMGNSHAIASLERKLVYTDPIHVLKIEKVA
jgi:hypothetical protein